MLDIKTIVFTSVIIFCTCTIMVGLIWWRNRTRFHGLQYLLVDFVFQTTAFLLIVSRGSIPDVLSIVIANTLAILGALLGLMGLERFLGMSRRHLVNILLVALFAAIHAWFTYGVPSLEWRTMNVVVGLLVICLQCCWLLLVRVEGTLRSMTRFVGLVFAGYCLVSLVRIVVLIVRPYDTENFFAPHPIDALSMLAYQVLFVLLTYSIALMVNGRLLADVRLQEEKFSKAFHLAPYAVTLTRLHDGRMYEVNDGFERITGYSAAEVLGKTTLDLKLWANPADRQRITAILSQGGRIDGMEFGFLKKSGEPLVGELHAGIISVNGVPSILAVISDITAKKQAQEAIHNALVESDRQRARAEELYQEKELLLREVHHRIKNNMSTVMGLLSMQAKTLHDPAAVRALDEATGRVRSMGILYDRLYRSQEFTAMSVREYLQRIIDEILAIMPLGTTIAVKTAIDDIPLGLDRLSPLGIIVNELMVNAIKYAFPDRAAGRIDVRLSRADDRIVFVFEDDGVGTTGPSVDGGAAGFGMELVSLLVRQLRGELAVERGVGMRYTIRFSGSDHA